MFVRNKWLMLFVLTTILLISACGNSENEVEDSNEVGDDQTVYPDEETSSSEREAEMDKANNPEPMNLSDAVEDREVWYSVGIKDSDDGVIGKDSGIISVYVFKDNEVSELKSMGDEFTLGSISDLSDEEVVDNLLNDIPEIEKENAEIDKEGLRDSYKTDISLNEPYTWTIESDATGNMTENMRFYMDKDSDEADDTYTDVNTIFDAPLGYAVNVFDRYYDGFISKYKDKNRFMLTRIDNEDDINRIKFDDPDTDKEDIIIE